MRQCFQGRLVYIAWLLTKCNCEPIPIIFGFSRNFSQVYEFSHVGCGECELLMVFQWNNHLLFGLSQTYRADIIDIFSEKNDMQLEV